MKLKFLFVFAVASLMVSCSGGDEGQKYSSADLVGKWHFVQTAYKDSVNVVSPTNGPCGQDFVIYTEGGFMQHYKVVYVNYESTGPQCFETNPGAGLSNNNRWKVEGDKIVWRHAPEETYLYSQKILKLTADTLIVKTAKHSVSPSNPESVTTYVRGQM